MKRFAILAIAVALAAPALAAEEPPAGAAAGENPMKGWVPRKVKNDAADRKEIMTLFKAMEAAGKAGNLDAAAALVDFPVLMVTDDARGEAKAAQWTKEQWMEVMAPFYKKPNPEMRVTHKPTISLLTDSLASVSDEYTMTMGKQKIGGRSATLLVRRDGTWLVKAMVEGGWGDAMKDVPAARGERAGASGAPSGEAAKGGAGAGPEAGAAPGGTETGGATGGGGAAPSQGEGSGGATGGTK